MPAKRCRVRIISSNRYAADHRHVIRIDHYQRRNILAHAVFVGFGKTALPGPGIDHCRCCFRILLQRHNGITRCGLFSA